MNPVDLVRELADALEHRERAWHDSLHDDDWYSARAEFAPPELLTRARAFLEQARVIDLSGFECRVGAYGNYRCLVQAVDGDEVLKQFHPEESRVCSGIAFDTPCTVHVVVQVGGERC